MDLVGFEEAQQLRLHLRSDLADFVEEQRAAGGGSNHALERVRGAGEGAPAVAEQLALEQIAGHGGAVERHERPVGAIRGPMNGPGDHLLAGAGLAGNQHRNRVGGDPPRRVQDFDHLFGGPDAFGVAVERIGRPQRRTLLLVAAVALERERQREQLADRRKGTEAFQVAARLNREEPGFIAAVPERQVLDEVGRRRRRGGRFGGVPRDRLDDADPGGRLDYQRQRRGTPGASHQGDGFRAEDVGMAGELEKGDGRVEGGRVEAFRCNEFVSITSCGKAPSDHRRNPSASHR
jgi:hypothetical protein